MASSLAPVSRSRTRTPSARALVDHHGEAVARGVGHRRQDVVLLVDQPARHAARVVRVDLHQPDEFAGPGRSGPGGARWPTAGRARTGAVREDRRRLGAALQQVRPVPVRVARRARRRARRPSGAPRQPGPVAAGRQPVPRSPPVSRSSTPSTQSTCPPGLHESPTRRPSGASRGSRWIALASRVTGRSDAPAAISPSCQVSFPPMSWRTSSPSSVSATGSVRSCPGTSRTGNRSGPSSR